MLGGFLSNKKRGLMSLLGLGTKQYEFICFQETYSTKNIEMIGRMNWNSKLYYSVIITVKVLVYVYCYKRVLMKTSMKH